MNRSLSPIGENDQLTSNSDATSYEDLPMVSPKVLVRTFDDTTQRQNAGNAKLRKQLLAYKEQEAKLSDRVQELEELTTALTTGTKPHKQNRKHRINLYPTSRYPVQPSGLNSAGPSTPRRCVSSFPTTRKSSTNRHGRKFCKRTHNRDWGT